MNKILAALFAFIFACCFNASAFSFQQPQTHSEEQAEGEEGEIFLNIKPKAKDAIFNENVVYDIDIKSTYKVRQDGKISYVLTTDDGKPVHKDSVKVNIGPHGSSSVKFKLPAKTPGFYELSFRLNLSYYDDTVRRVFGYKATEIKAQISRPADFTEFWQKSKQELAKIQPKYKILERNDLSTPKVKVYQVEMQSWGNVTIKGFLSIPERRPAKLPVRYVVPGYLVAMEPITYDVDFATFCINVRGNGNSKDAIDTKGIQYNMYNIADKNNYIYRGVYLDCLRGVDFIAAHTKLGLDTSRILVQGGSQGGALAIVVAALDKRVNLVITEEPLYSDIHNSVRISKTMRPASTSPIGYFTRHISQNSRVNEPQFFRTWDYYDPLNFAPLVRCPVLMGIGLLDELCPPSCSWGLFNRFGSDKKEIWSSPDKAHEVDQIYYRFQNQWLREHYMLP
ncbi:MAG: hypothetical protein EOP46_05380 [Sphingobacteriaceae bacterium]|nr:MAG: hypothetical protein EOP46_05380 [Sphingobacteriaceae bacterium]